MPRVKALTALVAAALCCWPAVRAQEATGPSLRPTGPVKINADRAEWEKGGAMVYSGNVRLESGDLKLGGERLQLKQFGDGEFQATINGSPATLDHAGLAVGADENRQPVTARAKQLDYDSRSEIVEIAGEALLTRGTDEIRGQNIRYDVTHRRIEAAGGEGGQVQIVIQPPPKKSAGPNPVPAPAPTPTPAPASVAPASPAKPEAPATPAAQTP